MPIPQHIDLFRFLALCFGIRVPSDTKRDRKASLEALCRFLELSPERQDALRIHLKRLLKSFTRLDSRNGEGWLEFPEIVGRLIDTLQGSVPILMTVFTPKILFKLNEILDNPRIPKSALDVLLPVLVARAARTAEDPASRPRKFCLDLAARFPTAFDRAVELYQPAITPADDGDAQTSDRLEIHQMGRTFARLERAEGFQKRPRAAIEAALHAWSGAFESSIYSASLFIWYLSRPLDVPPEKLKPPQGAAGREGAQGGEPKKGPVFQQARDWCKSQGVDFPFYPKLDKLRHSHAHEDYKLAAKKVELRGLNAILDTFSVKGLVSQVQQDVLFAHFFQQGLTEALSERYERSPAVEAAWQAAVELLPELALADAPREPKARRPAKPKKKPASADKPKGKDKDRKKSKVKDHKSTTKAVDRPTKTKAAKLSAKRTTPKASLPPDEG